MNNKRKMKKKKSGSLLYLTICALVPPSSHSTTVLEPFVCRLLPKIHSLLVPLAPSSRKYAKYSYLSCAPLGFLKPSWNE
jgi:hypothetical protein